MNETSDRTRQEGRDSLPVSSRGRGSLHRMLRFGSTAWAACLSWVASLDAVYAKGKRKKSYLVGSIVGSRSATRRPSVSSVILQSDDAWSYGATCNLNDSEHTLLRSKVSSESCQQRAQMGVLVGYRNQKYARRLRSGQPELLGMGEG